ncbi:hypothetical protein MKW94_005377 [Papaver nudicaule]|uniref:Retrotransposon Copia-like N-terminal domain-containing protein n=1 Tax=Papaver nudicaule TaxID=74823 RepID=A0AA41SGU9_PAPNU|nr:hypothetical protein [Papaver nudicaule]
MCELLDETNYLLWRCDVDLVLGSQGLRHYVDTKVPIPPTETLDPIRNKLIPNPEYEEWVKTDQYILTEMRRTITEPMLNQINGLKTSREVWTHFEKSYFDEHSVKIPELRQRLLTLRKGDLAVPTYFAQIFKIRNVLWFLGHSVSEDDSVRCALGGLGHEYDGFVQGKHFSWVFFTQLRNG